MKALVRKPIQRKTPCVEKHAWGFFNSQSPARYIRPKGVAYRLNHFLTYLCQIVVICKAEEEVDAGIDD